MMGGDDRLRRRGRLPNRGYPISNWRPVDFQLAAPTGRASRGRHKLRRARRRCLHRCANAGRHGRCGARRVGPRPTIPASPSCSPPAMPRRRPLARGTCFCRSRIALTSSPVSCVRSRRLPGNRRLADLKVSVVSSASCLAAFRACAEASQRESTVRKPCATSRHASPTSSRLAVSAEIGAEAIKQQEGKRAARRLPSTPRPVPRAAPRAIRHASRRR